MVVVVCVLEYPSTPILHVCGDGVVDIPNDEGNIETCDDGNVVGRDGCSSVCLLEPSLH